MSLTLADYLNPDQFPMTSKKGLSAQQQFRIDAFNFDNLVQYEAEGNELSQEQAQALAEFKVKIPAQKHLTTEIE